MDVTDDASMVAGVERIIAEQGRLDVLVNNAGYGSYGAVEDVPIDEARRQFEVNVFGLARLTQLVTPHMRAHGASGRIINISSSAGSSTSRSARGTTRPSSRWRASATACASSSRRSASTSCIIEPGPIRTEWNAISRESLVEVAGYGVRAPGVRRREGPGERRPSTRRSGPGVVARKIAKAATTSTPGPGTQWAEVRARSSGPAGCCPTERWMP